MDMDKPSFPDALFESVKGQYPQNCMRCDYLRAVPGARAYVCLKGGSPQKVDILQPALTCTACKYRE
jgi:hypothetical protein